LEVKKSDVVYDLGCGDGRIVVAAAKIYGVWSENWISRSQNRSSGPRSVE
jgi:hypothetical protein